MSVSTRSLVDGMSGGREELDRVVVDVDEALVECGLQVGCQATTRSRRFSPGRMASQHRAVMLR